MNETGRDPDFVRTEAQRKALIDSLALDNSGDYRVDRRSPTWQAVKSFLEEQVKVHYMPTLRNVSMDHGQTQYARGAMDVLDRLLEFGGEEV